MKYNYHRQIRDTGEDIETINAYQEDPTMSRGIQGRPYPRDAVDQIVKLCRDNGIIKLNLTTPEDTPNE